MWQSPDTVVIIVPNIHFEVPCDQNVTDDNEEFDTVSYQCSYSFGYYSLSFVILYSNSISVVIRPKITAAYIDHIILSLLYFDL